MYLLCLFFGVGGKLFKPVLCLHVDSMACVWVGMNVSEWFLVINVGLRVL